LISNGTATTKFHGVRDILLTLPGHPCSVCSPGNRTRGAG
jgi:hypothetical protein